MREAQKIYIKKEEMKKANRECFNKPITITIKFCRGVFCMQVENWQKKKRTDDNDVSNNKRVQKELLFSAECMCGS